MTYKEIEKLQKMLDEEITDCPKCNRVTRWWELRTYGNCFDCYAESHSQEKEDEKSIS
jgi:predicted nucleic acid-binding Zn ribbon protein